MYQTTGILRQYTKLVQCKQNYKMSPPSNLPTPIKSRILAAIRGAFVADAAAMGTHWIYNPQEMLSKVPSKEAPEFKDPPTPSYYSSTEFPGHYGTGMLSPYGEQMLFVTEYVAAAAAAASGGSDDVVDGPTMSVKLLEWAESFGGRPDSALKTFMENMKKEDGKWPNCGADDYQAHIYMKIVPVTCMFAGKPNLVEKVTDAIRAHQNNDMAVAFGIASARILEAVLLGGNDLGEVLRTCEKNLAQDDFAEKEAVLDALERGRAMVDDHDDLDSLLLTWSHEVMKDKPDSPMYDVYGRSCALPGSFLGPVYLFHKAAANKYGTDKQSWYEMALRENILAAGDTCSRAVFVGAVFAAIAESVPENWSARMHGATYAKVDVAAMAIAEKASG